MNDLRVLVASKSFGYGSSLESLHDLFRKYSLTPTFSPLDHNLENLGDYNGIIIGTSKVTREILSHARHLSAIIKYGVGIDNIDVAAARELGVQVLNLPGINSLAVAELAIGLMFAVSRKIVWGDRLIRSGRWDGLIGSSVAGKILGIIGTGSIGCTLVRLAAGLQMQVVGYDISQNQAFLKAGGQYVKLDTLLSTADFVSIHLTLNSQTMHFMDRQKLFQMKLGAFLINTSRGKVVDEQALVEALRNGHLGGAALDVFESEPPTSMDLIEMDNVVATPHIGAYTDETLRSMDETCVSTLSLALQSGTK
jgi:phosphoglycerate dehydrogenase-like enzyme